MPQTSVDVAADPARPAVAGDLLFWTAVGVALAALSGPLADAWAVPRAGLVGIGLGLLVIGPSTLWLLRDVRPLPRRLVVAFGAANIALTPVALVVAALDLFEMSQSGDVTLAAAAAVTLLFGAWQLGRERVARGAV